MPDEKKHGVLHGIATFTGRVAGSVEGEVHTVVDTAKHFKEPPKHEDTRFEDSDLDSKWTFITGVCVLIVLFVTTGLMFFYFSGLAHYRASISQPALRIESHRNVLPPEPRLQRSPREDLKHFREYENWELTHYHWVDKAHGIVAIPIEQAIDVVAKRGIPPTKTPPNATSTPPQEGTRETGFEGKVEPEPR